MMRIALIVAMDRGGVIGRGGALPWHLPADLRWFRRQTLGKPVVMGRRTYQSIGRALPQRCNIVLTRAAGFQAPDCLVAPDVATALALATTACPSADEVMVIGGAQVYRSFLPAAERIYLTLVEADVPGDVWFPSFEQAAWQVVWEEAHTADDRHAHPFRFRILERRDAA